MRNTFGDWQKEASIDERVWEPGTRDGVGAGPARQTTTQVWLSLDPCTPKTSPKSLGRPWVLAPLLPCLRLWVCVQTGAAAQGGCLKSSSPSLCSCCVSGASAKVLQSGCLVGLVLAAVGVSGVVCVYLGLLTRLCRAKSGMQHSVLCPLGDAITLGREQCLSCCSRTFNCNSQEAFLGKEGGLFWLSVWEVHRSKIRHLPWLG